MDYKCKICAGDLDVDFASGVAVCQYCGVKQTIPTFTSEKSTLLYQQAEHLLKQNEFDKATNLFNQLLITDKSNSDVYWSLLMCKYGVTYVEDPKTKKFMPTCNRTHFGSILNEELYAKAIEFANPEKQKYYTETANEIDSIQKKILSISKKEKPFDIFISYKETTADGQRTKDSIVAQELYEDLTNAGYKVFFSRITLEDKIGTDYEPYIYAALASSKLMITVCSSSENINSVWVRNEWSRYIGLCQNDKSKSLIPLYFDMEATQLPDEFASLPSYNINTDGFKQELLRGIKKLIPLPIMLAEKRKKRRKILGVSAAVLAVCMVVGVVFSIPYIKKNNEYNKIMTMYRNGQYPQALWEFEKLGSFRDSKEMVEKCESSWRKSVSTAATDNLISGSSHGAYYVSANGTVETFSHDAGTSNENIKIDEHGKVVSIADNYDLFALHEDGHLDNFLDFEKYDNIIKISPLFNATPIALLSDGTLKYGNLYDKYNDPNDVNDEWMTEISTWKNIVDFKVFIERSGAGFCMDEVIVGIHDDGSVSSLIGKSEIKEAERFREFLESLEKVKSIDISFHYVEDKYQAHAGVLTTDNKLITYAGGKIQTVNIDGAVDIGYIYSNDNYNLYVLYENGEVSLVDGKTIIEDVVYMKNGFFVTRSGSIYYCKTGTLKPANAKTTVFEEWALRNLTQPPQKK